ncbi:sulfite exporter TauE/SafE family protein [Halalkalibacter urbisdiaboli]|uniref:urease accessory protein UreH domain-containing protein n=1 Tax=Halalkalibacter urbisdiaboli TaxID=1960589 RepID=UPI000B439BA1|nr:sulfite exporter TauE/SafE family protein [Halalkalibacter urbisdiaboli]
MYDFFNAISQFFYGPLTNLSYGTEHIPLLSALIIGLLGAAAPCQFTGNISAITLYGNRSFQHKIPWGEVFAYILGKIVVFSGLGLIVWVLGEEFQRELTGYLPWVRKFLGPLLIFIGLYLMGVIRFSWTIRFIKERSQPRNKLGAFLLGSSFSLGFCPTMFLLFFMLLMPMVLSTSYGFVLPSIFAIGTAIPFLIAIFLIWYFGLSGALMKKSRKVGLFIQRFAGGVMIFLGILDTMTYWSF